MSGYKRVVCSNCGMGDWQDHEPGDTLRCPWCEHRVNLIWDCDFEGEYWNE
jgi:DNA-directed RNA polymerase subunit RPC12/RpoP